MSDGRVVWRRGDDNEKRKAVWEEHKRRRLDTELVGYIEKIGADQIDVIAIKRIN